MKKEKVIFLDRDGVINKDPGGWTEHSYVTRWEDFHFLPGAREAIKKLRDNGYRIVIVSNQAGVAKGFYSEKALDGINSKMVKEIEASGGKIARVYYCIHQDSDKCDCRKPNTGMFKKAARELGFDIEGAYFIGDGRMDVEAGKKAGLKTALLLCGKTSPEAIGAWEVKPDFIFPDLLTAVNFIMKGEK